MVMYQMELKIIDLRLAFYLPDRHHMKRAVFSKTVISHTVFL